MITYSREDFDENLSGKELAEAVINSLQGTCATFDDEGFSPEETDDIYSETDVCETCGWWVETWELEEEGNCNDCVEDED